MDIAQILRSEGFKVTPQRIAIYDALRGHHNHPTAEMIYHSLRPTHPSMSLATVYKTMEIFEKIGLVKVLEVGDERAHYDWDTTAHAHIINIKRVFTYGKGSYQNWGQYIPILYAQSARW